MSKAARVRSLPSPPPEGAPSARGGLTRGKLVALTERGEGRVRLPDGAVRVALLATAFPDRLLVQAIRNGTRCSSTTLMTSPSFSACSALG